MCGIITYTGRRDAAPLLLDGLRRLEYRGYDSAGIAMQFDGRLSAWKAAGRLDALESRLPATISGTCGIGHTRWATHGAAIDANAHPHVDASGRVAIVHNGIVENVDALRAELVADGVDFASETDTEVLAHLLARHDGPLDAAMRAVLARVVGTYGIAAIDRDRPDRVVLARCGSPVIIGVGDGETFAASDMSALSRHTREVVHLDEGEVAIITPDGFEVTTLDARPATKRSTTLEGPVEDYDKGGHAHYLHREITDQPETVRRALAGRLDARFATARLGGLNLEPRELLGVRRVRLLGCGSALYAGMSGAHMIESLARLPCDAESAAEFRYRSPVIERDTLYVAVSQSGETIDTLAAVREIRRKGGIVLGVVNGVGSTIAREVDGGIYLHAGPEVSVASTKAWTGMLSVFALLALLLGRLRDVSPQRGAHLVAELEALPDRIDDALALEPHIAGIAERHARCASAFFVGRTAAFPVAVEGAQKLKEISYVHAEAYPASELKHGPLALVTEETPCVVLLPDTELLGKSMGSLEEIRARSAPVIALTDSPLERIDALATDVIRLPPVDPLLKPILMGVALQLFAYHAALALGRDIDRPRNLAKSVTVE